ncbi:MAG: GNAT family N-acetyltransferase [Ruminococcaceae bacterium]|nr:GNAT family N-acetyltransferase [Oscillospiraceae bacterium]
MEYVWAGEDRLTDILSLWKQGFPADGEEDVYAFWNSLKAEARPLLLLEEGEARSMAFVIPAQMDEHTVWYVYAAATAVAYRGRGYFGRLLQELFRRATDAGVYGLFLRPATSSLFAYYARFGFEPLFYTDEFDREVKQLYSNAQSLKWDNVTCNFAAHRRQWLSRCGVPAVVWSETVTKYAVDLLENGNMLVSEKGLVMYTIEDNRMQITELLCDEEDTIEVLSSLSRQFACQIKRVCRPPKKGTNGKEFGMFRATGALDLQNSGWYMGFSLE